LTLALLIGAAGFAQTPSAGKKKAAAPAKQPAEPALVWRDVTTWGGRGPSVR
jgi:hypothetical protein